MSLFVNYLFWSLGGAAVSNGERIWLTPGAVDHSGYLWSRIPILTNTFELEFTFEIANAEHEPKMSTPRTQGFALW